MARIYAGFHYRFSTRVGQDMGRKIGRLVVESLMQKTSVAENPAIVAPGSARASDGR